MKWFARFLCFVMVMEIAVPKECMHFIMHLPEITHHYLHHAQEHVHLSGFIAKHSSKHAHGDDEHADHKDLPFNHSHSIDGLQLHAYYFQDQKTRLVGETRVVLNNSLYVCPFYSSNYHGKIWQPPKAC